MSDICRLLNMRVSASIATHAGHSSAWHSSRRRRSSGFGVFGMLPNLGDMIDEARHTRPQDRAMTHKLKQPVTLSHADSGENMKRVLRHRHAEQNGDQQPRADVRAGTESSPGSVQCLSELDEDDLLCKLEQSDQLYEQFDLLYHLYLNRGLDYDTGWTNRTGQPVTVSDLVKELYERAGSMQHWWLVRFTAGMLDMRVENLPMFLTDLLVRQKQVTVGLPPEPPSAVIGSPLACAVLAQRIRAACGGDLTLGVLTQELLVYLSMLAKTEPQLFASTCRVRVGLIVRVMGSEMGRALGLNAEEATEHLLGLSPYEMKTLLHHILSGKEFHAEYSDDEKITLESDSRVLDFRPRSSQTAESHLNQTMSSDRRGQWLRRRKIDGALSRVPAGFYRQMWQLLERLQGLEIHGQVIGQQLTREMTAGETKFALQVESIITAVPVPEYRQLVVEALSLLVRLPELDPHQRIDLAGRVLPVERLVRAANRIFLADQAKGRRVGDDAAVAVCGCAEGGVVGDSCGGACGICNFFYDTAPSGRFGTLTYLLRALPELLDLPADSEGRLCLDCPVQ